MNNPILIVKNLTKKFTNGATVVNKISFDIKSGEIVGLLGTNGAGKTTIIQMLLGVMAPTLGDITYFGEDFYKSRSKILQHISFASTYIRMPSKLTVYENLSFHAQLYGISSLEIQNQIEYYLKLFGIPELKNKLTGRLSSGQASRLMLAKAFITKPKIVLLDEPTAALDPEISYVIREFILDQRKKHNTSILFTSHNMDEVASICDRVLVLKSGEIIANNTPTELANSVNKVHVQIFVAEAVEIEKAEKYARGHNIKYKLLEREIEFEVQENKIVDLITGLSGAGISYSNISINKPTLEDYFLSISKI